MKRKEKKYMRGKVYKWLLGGGCALTFLSGVCHCHTVAHSFFSIPSPNAAQSYSHHIFSITDLLTIWLPYIYLLHHTE